MSQQCNGNGGCLTFVFLIMFVYFTMNRLESIESKIDRVLQRIEPAKMSVERIK